MNIFLDSSCSKWMKSISKYKQVKSRTFRLRCTDFVIGRCVQRAVQEWNTNLDHENFTVIYFPALYNEQGYRFWVQEREQYFLDCINFIKFDIVQVSLNRSTCWAGMLHELHWILQVETAISLIPASVSPADVYCRTFGREGRRGVECPSKGS